MEKRVFLAIFLSFAVLAIYQTYFAPPPPPQVKQAAPPAPPATPAATPAGAGAASSPPAPAAAAPAAAPVVGDSAARDVVVESDTVSAVFTTRGATLKSWKLKRYFNGQRQPLELVPQDIPDSFPRPFTLAVDDATVSATLRAALFQPSVEALTIGSGTGTLKFCL